VQPRPPSAWRARTRGRRWVTGIGVLVVIALAVAGFAGSRIVSHLRHYSPVAKVSAAQPQKPISKPASDTTPKKPKAQPTQTMPKSPAAKPVRQLPIKLAMAFGPDGTADGDNPQNARLAISAGSTAPWQTDWYATPTFGMLKHGTGLLLDMGSTVTITSLRVQLSPYRGADLQLRLGDTPADLRAAARADNVGGTVQINLQSPQRARYVLVWFTLLPPNGSGHYEESVYRVVVNGRL